MSTALRDVVKMVLIAVVIIFVQYFILGFIFPKEDNLLKMILRISGMMFLINFLAYFIVNMVHQVQPTKSVFIYFFTILLKMILVIFLILKFPIFKNNVILVMLNYILYLGLTIYFLKNRILT